jgi:hypothetical protein
VVFGDGEPVSAMALDDILESIGRPVSLLKIDAEYSEFPILLTSRLLASRVRRIVGEVHEMGGEYDTMAVPDVMHVSECPPPYTMERMLDYLCGLGFEVSYHRLNPQWQVIFTATNLALPAS